MRLSGGKALHMNKLYFVIAVICFHTLGCSKRSVETQADPPQAIKDLQLDAGDCFCHPYVNQYIWEGQNVYVLLINSALNIGYFCDWYPVFYHSDGQKFPLPDGYTNERFFDNSRFVKTVWSCN